MKTYNIGDYKIIVSETMVSIYHNFDSEHGNDNKLIMQNVSNDFSKILKELLDKDLK